MATSARLQLLRYEPRLIRWTLSHLLLQLGVQFHILPFDGCGLAHRTVDSHDGDVRLLREWVENHGSLSVWQGKLKVTELFEVLDQEPERFQMPIRQALLFQNKNVLVEAWQQFAAIKLQRAAKEANSFRRISALASHSDRAVEFRDVDGNELRVELNACARSQQNGSGKEWRSLQKVAQEMEALAQVLPGPVRIGIRPE